MGRRPPREAEEGEEGPRKDARGEPPRAKGHPDVTKVTSRCLRRHPDVTKVTSGCHREAREGKREPRGEGGGAPEEAGGPTGQPRGAAGGAADRRITL